jgi:hypothetical protein
MNRHEHGVSQGVWADESSLWRMSMAGCTPVLAFVTHIVLSVAGHLAKPGARV